MPLRIDRRCFLEGAGTLVLSLALGRLRPAGTAGAAANGAAPGASAAYAGWQDVYRARWAWDRVAKGTHFVNCWYQRGCNWNVFVKDGIVWREEQAATYAPIREGIPDYNPRGCQKGACYSDRMVDATRLLHPLERVGARGEARWKRIGWDEALRSVADRVIDVLLEDGPGAIAWDPGGGNTGGCNGLGTHRAGALLDTPILDVNGEVGDHHPGALATMGKISFASSADDLFYSDLILIWGGNPLYTQIPNAHFIAEARYHGARVVAIAPDYSASSIHCDEWIPVSVGSDAALGLALAHVIVEEDLVDVDFVREQTDLPLLVRTRDRRFLRQSDLEEGGDESRLFVFDARSGTVREAPRDTLSMGSLDPALEGKFRVRTREGEVEVTPVFELLRRQLAEWTPERAAAITGVPPGRIRSLGRSIARARAATCLAQSNFSKFYHGLEMERCQILVFALAGQIGRKGSGFNAFPAMQIAGVAGLVLVPGRRSPRLENLLLAARGLPEYLRLRRQGLTQEMILYELAREHYRKGSYVGGALFYHHAGLAPLHEGAAKADPALRRPLSAYFEEAYQKGWQIRPSTTRTRIFFEVGGNILRRARSTPQLAQSLLPGLDLLVTLDWRMSNTALHSDFVFPVAGWYEKDDITWATPLAPYAHATTRAVDPLGESKTDWEFHCLLLGAIQRRARERGIESFRDRAGGLRRLDRIYDEMTFGRRFTEENPRELLDELLRLTTNLDGIDWEGLETKGFERYTGLGADFLNIGNATDIEPNETITANTWHVQDKQPWPTFTRRIQLYLDHPWYLELGEELPVHKDDPPFGGNHPLRLLSPHTRWSIHASWRDQQHMLRLQRGEPLAWIAREDAGPRGIGDGDRVRLRNDVGTCELRAKIVPSLRPGQVIVYHAWEPFEFPGGSSYQALVPGAINPLQLAGGYFHLQPLVAAGTPTTVDRGTRVELERMEGPASAS